MKIKSLTCMNNIFGLPGSPRTIQGIDHQIEYNEKLQSFVINGKVIIPLFKINEISLDEPLTTTKK